MGHFYRALNLIAYLDSRKQKSVLFINNHAGSLELLEFNNIKYEIVPLDDLQSNWESVLIHKYGVTVWINDRLNTDIRHANHVKRTGIKLVTFDDEGSGAVEADLHIAAFAFDVNTLQGKRVLKGPDYLVLNPEIDRFKRLRTKVDKIVVSMGGSDTSGVTIKVIEILKNAGKSATVITGPGFEHTSALEKILTPAFTIRRTVPSLIEEFSHYDMAISGGGMTAFEASASGLPCIIIASELFEIPNARYLEKMGSARYAGFHQQINTDVLKQRLDIENMSRAGMTHFSTKGVSNIFRELDRL